MTTNGNSFFDPNFPQTLTANDLSIAVIGPDERLRAALVTALEHCHHGEVREFSSYPPGLDDLPHLLDQNHGIIIIELDSNPEYALDVMEGICVSGGSTVMVYSKKTDPELTDPDLLMRCMRVGAREFLSLPFAESAIAEALVRAAARRPPARGVKKAVGKLYVFCGAKGGAGVTAIACSFAMAVARQSARSTLLIDLDLPLGDTAINLGITPEYSTIDALQSAARLDASFLSRLLSKHASGLSVLAAPGTFSTYYPTNEAISKLLSVARSEFENVVVDAGSKLDSTATAAHFKEASTLYLVTQSGIPELRNANRLIAQYAGTEGPNVEVVLNRFESRGTRVSEDDLKKALTRAAAWKIPNDYNAVRRMQDTAMAFSDSSISLQIDQMARSACGLPEPTQKKKGFSLMGLGRSAPAKEPEADGSASLLRLGLLSGSEPTETVETAPPDDVPTATVAGNAPVGEQRANRIFNGRIYRRGEDGWQVTEGVTAEAVVEWKAPEPVAYGAPLGSAQFNATATVPGRFAYTPCAGYLLPAGQHTLWATFIPEDTAAPMVETAVVLGVTRAKPVVEWPKPAAVCYGTALGKEQLNATASVPGAFEYLPAAGDVPSVGTQSLLVRFTPDDGSNYEEALAEVALTVVKAPTTIRWAAPAVATYGTPLGAQHLNAVASVPGTLSYAPAEGTVLGAGRHTLTVEFIPADATNHTEARAEVSLTVAKARPTILWPAPHAVSYGTPLSRTELNASCPVAGKFVYIPGEGAVLGAGRHMPRAIFTPEDTANYHSAQATVPLVVTKAVPVVSWPAPEAIEYGTPLGEVELCATAPVPGTFAYSPVAGSIPGEGSHTLSVTFTPIDAASFTTARATVPLSVKAARPVEISWPAPAAIAYGTPLGSAQLNARAAIAGSFTYEPAEGEVLGAGMHTLSATFKPADANRKEVRATVELAVTKAMAAIEWRVPRTIAYGTALSAEQLNAVAAMPGTLSYSPGAGEIPAAGTHQLAVAFTPADEVNVENAHAEVALTVTRATPVITWAAPGPIDYGTALDGTHLCAACSIEGSFVYAPSLGTVLTPGTQTLSVSFVASDARNYAMAQASVSITVNQSPAFDLEGGGDLEDLEEETADPLEPFWLRDTNEESKREEEGSRMVCIDVGSARMADSGSAVCAVVEAPPLAPRVMAMKDATESDADTRMYRGAMYRKGPDGQWHLVRS